MRLHGRQFPINRRHNFIHHKEPQAIEDWYRQKQTILISPLGTHGLEIKRENNRPCQAVAVGIRQLVLLVVLLVEQVVIFVREHILALDVEVVLTDGGLVL